MDRMSKITRLINSDGEIVTGDEKRFPAYFDEEKGYLFWPRKRFAKMFSEISFPAGMTDLEIGRMTRLSKHIWSNTNMLAYRGHGGARPYSIEMIGAAIGLQSSQAHAFIAKMTRLGIMAQAKTTVKERTDVYYYLNPMYYFSSSRIPLHLYLIFRRQLDAVLPPYVIQRYNEAGESNGTKAKAPQL
jgi:hypothetical protein